MQLPYLADRRGAIFGLADYLQAGMGSEHRGEALADHGLIISDEAPCRDGGPVSRFGVGRGHGAPPSGSTAATTNPPSGAGPASSEPPSSDTRSAMPASPWPGPRP
jgi:hypothetical protein